MSANSPRRRRRPTWLRALGWLGLLLVTALFVASVGHWWLAREAHAVAEGARAAAPPLPALAPDPQASAQPAAVPADDLPLVGRTLTGDQAAAAEFEERFAELSTFVRRLRGAAWRQPTSFLAVLAQLGMPATPGMTEAEAASVFLAEIAKFAPLLDQLRAELARGRWDYSEWDPLLGSLPFLPVALNTSRLLQLATEAQWLTGETDRAWTSLEMLALLADRANDVNVSVGFEVEAALRRNLAEVVARGLLTGGITDDQLEALPRFLSSYDPFAEAIGTVQASVRWNERLAERLIESSDARFQIAERTGSWKSPLRFGLAELLTSPTQIRDNVALMDAQLLHSLDTIDFGARSLRPGAAALSPPTQQAPDGVFADFYYRFFANIPGAPADLAAAVVAVQTRTDQATIASRLELEKRATGAYPATLPADAPHDPATGQPYFYRLTDDGDYELRGAGLNQADDGGDAKEDIVWPRRSRKIAPAASGVAAGR